MPNGCWIAPATGFNQAFSLSCLALRGGGDIQLWAGGAYCTGRGPIHFLASPPGAGSRVPTTASGCCSSPAYAMTEPWPRRYLVRVGQGWPLLRNAAGSRRVVWSELETQKTLPGPPQDER